MNDRLRAIADELRANQAVGDATLCETPGATRAIIHVRWMHYADPALAKSEQDRTRVRALNPVQHDIYRILELLRQQEGVDIRVEGREEINTRENSAKEYHLRLRRLEETGIITPQIPAQKNSTYADVFLELATRYPIATSEWSEYGFIPGADLLMEVVEGVQFLPAQTPAAELLARKSRQRYASGDKQQLNTPEILDGREDAAILLSAARESAPVTAILYGAAHRFGGTQSCGPTYGTRTVGKSYKDNIAVWNSARKHRDNTFSLLEVTPRAYWELERRNLRR